MSTQPYQCACVTGASSGIGLAYCHLLARQGINLVMVSRQHDVLASLAQELREQYQISISYYAIDLSKTNSAKQLADSMQTDAVEIDLLINNAGQGDLGEFLEQPWQHHDALIQLMLTSLTELCYLLLPQLLSKPHCAIINVSSILGLMQFKLKERSHRTLYRPIKCFVTAFTEQLVNQYSRPGVKLQALCPGLTDTQFHQRIGDQEISKRVPSWMWMSAEAVVNRSWQALTKSKRWCVVTGLHNRLFIRLSKYLAWFQR